MVLMSFPDGTARERPSPFGVLPKRFAWITSISGTNAEQTLLFPLNVSLEIEVCL
jgi:hypothetical protein